MLPQRPSVSTLAPGARPLGTAIAWLSTLIAKGPAPLQRQHLRRPPQALRAARLHCIVLDTSGSMRQQGRLALAKGHVALLLERAAREGDDVALLGFGGRGVELLLPPGRARASGAQRVRPLGGGGAHRWPKPWPRRTACCNVPPAQPQGMRATGQWSAGSGCSLMAARWNSPRHRVLRSN
ncbi:vWA domain-containing protein [Hylemonella gracilis]|uniref:vWA domain-containing protein n=1 Tax=Hylemonella gracilis TaxID=80880 RepID=UPI001F603399|nr:VWA domain-containing protein [Hylemonella gracilis]